MVIVVFLLFNLNLSATPVETPSTMENAESTAKEAKHK